MTTRTERHYTAYVIPHTHWDREWYRPFRIFQARLVDVIDSVLDLLEDPDYRRFTLDGQAIILDDYLELRPEREADIRRHVQAGRLRIGPWYVLADEFLVSPESLVRNLLMGREICERFGPSMPVCYTPDSFGHVSQLPLIAAGFGLPAIVFQRGVGDEGERLGSEFIWRAADGETEVFAAHLVGTYSGATALGHVDWELTDAYDERRAMGHLRAALYGVSGDEVADLPGWFRASLERVRGGLTAHTSGRALILLNGSDHLFPQPNIPEVLRAATTTFPEVEFVHGDVEEYVDAARASAGPLQTYQGEFRGSRYQHILAGVLSARLYLKQQNELAQTRLERYAEPLSALAWARTGSHPGALLREAWKLLLQNHPHDSICGCSVDAVHREMLTRFAGSLELSSDLCRRGFASSGGLRPSNIQAVHDAAKDAVTVFNPLPFRRRSVVKHELELPLGSAARLRVTDSQGAPVPVQVESRRAYLPGRSDQLAERVSLELLADLVPMGLTTFRLHTEGPEVVSAGEEPSTDLVAEGSEGDVRLENAHLVVQIAASGSVTLVRKASGAVHDLNLRFEDEADAGDEYDFSPLPGDQPLVFSRPSSPPDLLTTGPITATVRLSYDLALPERLTPDRRSRVGAVSIPLTLDLTLCAAEPFVRLRVASDNRAEDHRLRLRLSSGVVAGSVWADGHYDVIERPLRPVAEGGWFQTPPPTNHQRRFVAVSDAQRGLALFNQGLPEYEADTGPAGPELAVTLVRSVGWLSRDDLVSRPQGAGPTLPTPEAQCLGAHEQHLAIYPFAGQWWESSLLAEAQAFACPPLATPGDNASAGAPLLTLEGGLELSALKRAHDRDGLIVRVVNPAPVPVSGTLTLHRRAAAVHRVRLDETRLEAITPPGGRTATTELPLQLGPKSVRSFEFVLEGGEETTDDPPRGIAPKS